MAAMDHREPIGPRLARLTFAALAALAAGGGAAAIVYALRNPPPKRAFTGRWGDNVMGAAANATEGLSVKIDRMTDLMMLGGTLALGAMLLILAALCLLIAVQLRTQDMLRVHRAGGGGPSGGASGGGGITSSPTELSTQSETG
jgi:hypothetical protein